MKTSQNNKFQSFNEIGKTELIETNAGIAPLALAALVVGGAALLLDGTYYIGYAIGYLSNR